MGIRADKTAIIGFTEGKYSVLRFQFKNSWEFPVLIKTRMQP